MGVGGRPSASSGNHPKCTGDLQEKEVSPNSSSIVPKQTPSGGRVSTVLGCLVHYVQNYLFGATPLSLKKSLSCD